jgi:alcohol dehydrogenase YqhD (iron-dependent ADH family)
MILAIGGGSVIDSSKMAALSYYYSGNPFDISLQKHIPTKSLPVGVILTIAAAGSEMSGSAVITDPITKSKVGMYSELNRPIFTIMNPALTYSVSKYQTAVGIVDMMMHTLERYFSHSDPLELSDYLAEGMLQAIMEAGLVAFNNPTDYDSRSTLMMASSWSHNGLTSIGKPYGMVVHQIEHALSGLYPFVAHGAGLSVLFPAWAQYYCQLDVEKFDRFASKVMHSHLENKLENAKMGVLKLKEYFKQLGMPLTLRELGIDSPDIGWMVSKVTKNGTRAVDHFVQPLDAGLLTAILKSCR